MKAKGEKWINLQDKKKQCRRIRESLKNSEAGKHMGLDNMTEEEI